MCRVLELVFPKRGKHVRQIGPKSFLAHNKISHIGAAVEDSDHDDSLIAVSACWGMCLR